MLSELSIKDFLEKTASNTPVPGGGSVAALAAAIAASLSGMVAALTVGKKGFEEMEERMQQVLARAADIREKMIRFIDKDSDAFNDVMNAYRLPKDTPGEKEARSEKIESTLKNAAWVPLEVAREAKNVMDLAETVIIGGNKNAVTDGAVGAMSARTAVLAALYNVRINLLSIKDKAFAAELSSEADRLEREIKEKEDAVLAQVSI